MTTIPLNVIALEALRLIEHHGRHKNVAYRTESWRPSRPTVVNYFHAKDNASRMACMVFTDGAGLSVSVLWTRDAVGGWIEAGITMYDVDLTMSLDSFRDRILTPAVCSLLERIP